MRTRGTCPGAVVCARMHGLRLMWCTPCSRGPSGHRDFAFQNFHLHLASPTPSPRAFDYQLKHRNFRGWHQTMPTLCKLSAPSELVREGKIRAAYLHKADQLLHQHVDPGSGKTKTVQSRLSGNPSATTATSTQHHLQQRVTCNSGVLPKIMLSRPMGYIHLV